MAEKEKEKNWKEKLLESTEKHINTLAADGVQSGNIDMLGKLIDIHKDIKQENYWEEKIMRYNNYGTYPMYGEDDRYGRGRARDSMGRYRGDEIIEDMRMHYGDYMEANRNGRYSGDNEEAHNYMVKDFKRFYMHIMEESTPEQKEKLRMTARELSEMR